MKKTFFGENRLVFKGPESPASAPAPEPLQHSSGNLDDLAARRGIREEDVREYTRQVAARDARESAVAEGKAAAKKMVGKILGKLDASISGVTQPEPKLTDVQKSVRESLAGEDLSKARRAIAYTEKQFGLKSPINLFTLFGLDKDPRFAQENQDIKDKATYRAAQNLQMALGFTGEKVDGKIGPDTLVAVREKLDKLAVNPEFQFFIERALITKIIPDGPDSSRKVA